MLQEPFINTRGLIELPGSLFQQSKIKKENIMTFTLNLVNGISKILPLIDTYSFKTYKNEIRIKYDTVPDSIKETVDSCEGWTLDSTKKLISFKMIEDAK